jgi:CHAD domain-containing protein
LTIAAISPLFSYAAPAAIVMPFYFKKKESVAKAVRRLCCERIDDALETLEKGRKLHAVHNVRKEIKKMRSVLRLMREEIGKNAYSRQTRKLREAANLLTAFRDAQVKLNAFDGLTKDFKRRLPQEPFPEIKTALRKNCRAEEKKLGRAIASLKEILRESKQQLGKLKIESKGWRAIEPGLKKIYRRGHEAFEAARRKPTPENFHEWRKRVKDLWHQLRLLGPAQPRRLNGRAKNLEKLGDHLGDDHDLFMLREFITNQFEPAENIEAVDKLIGARQKNLRSKVFKLGRKIYQEKPNHFCRRMGDYWADWRSKT